MVSKEKTRTTISINRALLDKAIKSAKNDLRTFSNLVTLLLEKHLGEKK